MSEPRAMFRDGQACVISADGERWAISREVIEYVTIRKIPTPSQRWTLRRRVLGALRTVATDATLAEMLLFMGAPGSKMETPARVVQFQP